jgi:hypothetical protein
VCHNFHRASRATSHSRLHRTSRNALNGGRELGYEASLLSAVGLCASAPKKPPLNLPTQVHALATATKALATSSPKAVVFTHAY